MKRVMLNYRTLELEDHEVVPARLVKHWACPCGLPFTKEDIPLGTKYRVILDTECQKSGKCAKCHTPFLTTFILAEEGQSGIYKGLPKEIFEIEGQAVGTGATAAG